MKWSVDGQSPTYLAMTRMATLAPETVECIARHVVLTPGMRVLDVGCGSGEYVFRLGTVVRGVDFVGIDFDQDFVDFANDRVAGKTDSDLFEPVSPQNTYTFVQGDGLDLPFGDEEFDAVISHTYLTALPDYQRALAEMIRVCKRGGQVSSVTNLGSNVNGIGNFSLFPPVISDEALALVKRVHKVTRASYQQFDIGSGVPTYKVQRLFGSMALDNVGATPLGQYFCLSDSQMTGENYLRMVNLLHAQETEGVARARKNKKLAKQLPEKDWEDFLALADARRDNLISMMGTNQEWTWFGSAALLVWGTVPECGLHDLCLNVKEQSVPTDEMHAELESAGLRIRERVAQAGPGRICKIQVTAKPKKSAGKKNKKSAKQARKQKGSATERTVYACGYNLYLAREEAYETLLERNKKHLHAVKKAEKRAWDRLASGKKLKPLGDEYIYVIPMMWDTVAEAIEYGYDIKFFDLTKAAGMPACAVRATRNGYTMQSVAAHPDEDLAIQRALARVIAEMSAQFE